MAPKAASSSGARGPAWPGSLRTPPQRPEIPGFPAPGPQLGARVVHPLLDLRFFRSKAGLGDKRTEFTAGWRPPPPREAESLLPSARRPGLARAPHGSEPAGLAPGCGAGAPLPCWCTSVPPPSPCPSPGFSCQLQLLVRPLLTLPSGTLLRPDIQGSPGNMEPRAAVGGGSCAGSQPQGWPRKPIPWGGDRHESVGPALA